MLSAGTLCAQGRRGGSQEHILVPQCYWENFDFEHLAPAVSNGPEDFHDITFCWPDVLHFFPDHYRQFIEMDLKEVAGLSRDIPVSVVDITLAWTNSIPGSGNPSVDDIENLLWQQLCGRGFGNSVVQFQSGYTPGGPLWSVKTKAFEADELAAYLLAEVQKGVDGYEAALGPVPNVTQEELGGISPRWFWSGQGKEDYDKRLGIMLDDFVFWWSLTGLPMPPFLDGLFKYEDAPDYSESDSNQFPTRRVRQSVKIPIVREVIRKLYPGGKLPGVTYDMIIANIAQETGQTFDRRTVTRAFEEEFGKPK